MTGPGIENDRASATESSPTKTRTPGAGPLPQAMLRWGPRGIITVLGIGALVMILIGATLGLALAPSSASPAASSTGSMDEPGAVDIGFSQDMIIHHTQGVSMANLAQLHTQDSAIRIQAFDIASTQQTDIGEMSGWLDLWSQPRVSPNAPMAWMTATGTSGMNMNMGATTAASSTASSTASSPTTAANAGASDGAVMPGMATNAEMAKLQSLTGQASDIYFLQLMIRHHEGGAAMMTYAANHASLAVVRNFAGKMLQAQSGEITVMTQMLTARGAKPLPFTPPVMPTG